MKELGWIRNSKRFQINCFYQISLIILFPSVSSHSFDLCQQTSLDIEVESQDVRVLADEGRGPKKLHVFPDTFVDTTKTVSCCILQGFGEDLLVDLAKLHLVDLLGMLGRSCLQGFANLLVEDKGCSAICEQEELATWTGEDGWDVCTSVMHDDNGPKFCNCVQCADGADGI